MRRVFALLGLLLLPATSLTAQGVVVAPHAVYLDHRTRSASIVLYNPGAEATEVAVSFFYGYPITDSAGNFTLSEPATVDSAMPSAAGWIEAFPRRMTIPPLTRQTVRLLARPPAGLADGEYWARAMISAKGGSVPVSGTTDSSGIQIGLSLEVRTVIPVTYRKGVLNTGVRIARVNAVRQGDSLAVRARLIREGSSAYIGTARGALVNAAGKVVATFEEPIAIYYDAEPAFALKVAGLPAGPYRLRVSLTSERPDIAPELLLRAPAVRDSVEVMLP